MTHDPALPGSARRMPKMAREPSWGEFHSATPTPPNEPAGLGEVDLLGSFDDEEEEPRRMSTPVQQDFASRPTGQGARTGQNSHDSGRGDTTLSARIQAGRARAASRSAELDLINLDTDDSGEVVPQADDPHLQLYEGPTAVLPPPPLSSGDRTPATSLSSSTSKGSLARQRSRRGSSGYGPTPIPPPPRRMSTIDALGSLAGPSSPAALSPEAGDSFVFRAHAHMADPGASQASAAGSSTDDAEAGMRRLSISPSSSRTFSLGHVGLPAVGGVGRFPRKRPSGEGLRERERGRHERAGTDPWGEAAFAEKPYGGEDTDAGHEGNARASGSGSSGWKKGAATLGAKATQGIKSKWKTVLGPSTFTPSTMYDAFGVPYTATSPAGGVGPGGFSQKELDAPSATAMPVETTHHSPFAPRQGSWGATFTGGSYMPSSGAPGFAPSNGWTGHTEDEVKEKGEWSGTRLVGRREGTYEVLDEAAADALRPFFPARQRLSSRWNLLFSIDQHGASLSTFYRLIEKYSVTSPQAGNLLIIKDAQDRRFGVYMNEWIRRVEGTYTGSGESWLFKLSGNDPDVRAKVFKWTGRNHYFALCEGGFISFGGGDGKYGLYLDAALVRGSSATCPAYDNEVLCAEEGSMVDKARFECMGMEVWGT